jgi:hypothetical protein
MKRRAQVVLTLSNILRRNNIKSRETRSVGQATDQRRAIHPSSTLNYWRVTVSFILAERADAARKEGISNEKVSS